MTGENTHHYTTTIYLLAYWSGQITTSSFGRTYIAELCSLADAYESPWQTPGNHQIRRNLELTTPSVPSAVEAQQASGVRCAFVLPCRLSNQLQILIPRRYVKQNTNGMPSKTSRRHGQHDHHRRSPSTASNRTTGDSSTFIKSSLKTNKNRANEAARMRAATQAAQNRL